MQRQRYLILMLGQFGVAVSQRSLFRSSFFQ